MPVGHAAGLVKAAEVICNASAGDRCSMQHARECCVALLVLEITDASHPRAALLRWTSQT